MGGARGVAGEGAAVPPCTLALASQLLPHSKSYVPKVPSPPHHLLCDRFTELTIVLCQTNPSKQTEHVKYRSIQGGPKKWHTFQVR